MLCADFKIVFLSKAKFIHSLVSTPPLLNYDHFINIDTCIHNFATLRCLDKAVSNENQISDVG